VEFERRPKESCDRLKAKQSEFADKLKEPCQSMAFLVSSQTERKQAVSVSRDGTGAATAFEN
jgi:hypothetical protein